jgi:hypothetical protein
VSWFRVFTAVLAALIVFSLGMAVLAILASSQVVGSNDSEPEIVTYETVLQPPR